MQRAVVIDSVWSTRRVAGLPQGALLEVVLTNSNTSLVAFDVLGSGIGEEVLVVQGSVAAAWFPGTPPPVDALIVGSVDQKDPGAAGQSKRASRQTATRPSL